MNPDWESELRSVFSSIIYDNLECFKPRYEIAQTIAGKIVSELKQQMWPDITEWDNYE